MKIAEYLEQKYRGAGVISITKAEARILGIRYPLRSGWLKVHGRREISDLQQIELEQLLAASKKRYASAGLSALGVEPGLFDLGFDEREHLTGVARGIA